MNLLSSFKASRLFSLPQPTSHLHARTSIPPCLLSLLRPCHWWS